MGVPNELVGAWRRSGLVWKGRRVVDYVDALWLQTPEWFVDIRLVIDPAAVPEDAKVPPFFYRDRCFAGHAFFEAPRITWEHEIDVNETRSNRPDSSPLLWEDGVVLECGSYPIDGEEHPFVEEWLRTTHGDVSWSAEGDGTSARIEVGRWAVEVADRRPDGGFTAVRYELVDGTWCEYGSVVA